MRKVFFSYHSTDRPEVLDLAQRLTERGLDVWLDQEQLDRGRDWVPQLEQGLRDSQAFVVFWGPRGFGEFQEGELNFIKNRFVKQQAPCLVVTLPGTGEDMPEGFLSTANHVRMKYRGDAECVDSVYASVSGAPPARVATPSPSPEQRTDLSEALNTQARELKRDVIAFFVGASTDVPSVECMLRIRQDLLAAVGHDHVPARLTPPIETAGTYFAVLRGDSSLEQELEEHLDSYGQSDSPALEHLAAFLGVVDSAKARTRGGRRPQLVVTTRHDLMLERALLRAGLSFQRIVQYRRCSSVSSHSFLNVRREGGMVEARSLETGDLITCMAGDNAALNAVIASSRAVQPIEARCGADNDIEELRLDPGVSVILYKFAGSIDLPASCLLTSEDQVEFVRQILRCRFVPRAVRALFQNSPAVFLGYSLLDADLRLVRKTLFNEEQRTFDFRSILVRPRPGVGGRPVFCHAEERLWDQLLRVTSPVSRLRVVDAEEEDFMVQLRQRAAQVLE